MVGALRSYRSILRGGKGPSRCLKISSLAELNYRPVVVEISRISLRYGSTSRSVPCYPRRSCCATYTTSTAYGVLARNTLGWPHCRSARSARNANQVDPARTRRLACSNLFDRQGQQNEARFSGILACLSYSDPSRHRASDVDGRDPDITLISRG